MKKVVLLVFVFVVIFSSIGGFVFANDEIPIQEDLQYLGFNISGIRTVELFENAVAVQPGDCTSLMSPYFEGPKRDLSLNEDSTRIQVYYDEDDGMVCAIVFGTWPGTRNNDGVQEFDSIMRVYRGYDLLEVQDEPLIGSNPFLAGIPFHLYSWELPKGGGEFFFLFDFFQQQILGDQRLGMPHRDWSGVFRSELFKIYLPIIVVPEPVVPTPTPIPPTPTPIPPTPTPVPPTPTPLPPICPNWTIGATAPGFTVPAMAYKIGGNHYPNVGFLYFGETMSVKIKNPQGVVSDLPIGGETTVYNGSGNVVAEYGRDGSFEIVGGQGVFGEDFFTFDSSFPWQGITCRASFTIWDPELVLNALQSLYGYSRDEALQELQKYLSGADEATLTQATVWEWVKTH